MNLPSQQQQNGATLSNGQQVNSSAAGAGSTTPSASIASSTDTLTCQWNGCGERCPSAEQLYDHVCERHVGRKSTNNLNLTCQWGSCRTTTVKRDHITSHIRVHVPLKPHKCDFCQKAFKRPQDLKKHVKTHADDSVLMSDAEPSGNRGSMAGYGHSNGGMMQNPLSNLAATASAYYPTDHSMGGQNGYSHQRQTNPSYYSGPQQPSNYGPVYYSIGQGTTYSQATEIDTRKRAFDALNDFIGDIKRRAISADTYYDVGQRLSSYQQSNAGLSGAMTARAPISRHDSTYGSISDFTGSGGIGTMIAHAVNNPQTLPLPNLRTKQDLVSIDSFLEQLQATVYESTDQASAAGVQQPGVHSHYVQDGVTSSAGDFRAPLDHSPTPDRAGLNAVSAVAAAQHGSGHHVLATPDGASSMQLEPPALTPDTSTTSYGSTHSGSPHSHATPPSSHGDSFSMGHSVGISYPQLPSVPAISEFGNLGGGFNGAGGNGLAFDPSNGRRYQGGRLQSAAERPYPSLQKEEQERRDEEAAAQALSDMALRSPAMPQRAGSADSGASSAGEEDEAARREEAWVENIRVLEALRAFVGEKLRRGEYEDLVEGQEKPAAAPYPDLSLDGGRGNGEVLYPILAS